MDDLVSKLHFDLTVLKKDNSDLHAHIEHLETQLRKVSYGKNLAMFPQRYELEKPIRLKNGVVIVPHATHVEWGCNNGPFDYVLVRWYDFDILDCTYKWTEDLIRTYEEPS